MFFLKKEYIIAYSVFFIDQVTKYFARSIYFKSLTSFFNISFVRNYGTTFGFFQSVSCLTAYLIFFVILAIFVFAVYLFTNATKTYEKIAYAFIVGGAMSNITDRFIYGYVTDFLQFHLWNWCYPTFNIADSFIVIGILILMRFQLREK